MQKFLAIAVMFALAFAAQGGEKSQAAAPVKGQDGKGATVTKTEVAVPLTNREKKALDLYKKVEIVTATAPCCDTCSNCNPPKGGLFSRLRARRTAAVVSCENCSK